jgi:hypothetical protein
MGRIIQQNNGKTTVLVTGENISSITPEANTYVLGVDLTSGLYEKLNPDGSILDLEGGGGSSSVNMYNITYSGLVANINNSTLSGGSFYMITDFATIYDQPDFYIDGDSKGAGFINTYTGSTEPIIVLATSENTISIDAYQPTYPKDKIKYDWSWSNTEINSIPTYGRISERIDEYENRTDYDHRTVNYLRYQGYETGSTLTGTINEYDCTTGVMLGNGTAFSGELTTGSTIVLDTKNEFGYQVGVKVVNIIDDTTMDVVIDSGYTSTVFTVGNGYDFTFYTLNATGNYYDYKEAYIGQNNEEGYNEFSTFILDGGSLSNYISDYSVFYINGSYGNSGFLLANNVFGSNSYSNTIGDRSYNNTTWSWFVRNTIAGRFYSNKITSGFYSNNIAEYCYDNKIDGEFYRNHIGEEFYENITYNDFQNNLIGNGFNTNIINGDFYKNEIGNGFNQNNVGDQFYGNDIGNGFNDNTIGTYFINNNILEYFNNNTISYNFGYNKIGSYFNNNTIGSDFGYGGSQAQGNVIGDGFEYNTIGQYCYNNIIGNYFNNNIIGVEFEDNQIQNYFIGNTIGTGFTSNQIGNFFGNNASGVGTPIQNTIFNDFKYNKIGNFFGNDTNFPSISGGTNGDGGNIINDGFQYNQIGNNFIWNAMDLSFNNNIISNDFWFNVFSTNTTDNVIGNLFVGNVGGISLPIGDSFISNKIGNYGGFNIIGADFAYNNISNYFGNAGTSNTIGQGFSANTIGDYFGDDGTHVVGENIIGIDFNNNSIGNIFTNNVILDDFNRNNIDYEFNANTVYNQFNNNKIKTAINTVDFTSYYNGITGFTYSATGTTATDGIYTGLTQNSTTGIGLNATFDIEVSGGTVIGVTGNTQGELYEISDTLTILGSQINGTDGVDNVVITITGISQLPSVYEAYTCDIFERQDGTKRLSYYDSSDMIQIKNINQ